MTVATKTKQPPMVVAELENDGRYEGRVISSGWKENNMGTPQAQVVVAQRIRRPGGKKIAYNNVPFVLFGSSAEVWMEKIRVGDHVRIFYQAMSWRRGERIFLSLQIMCFRKYAISADDLDEWAEEPELFDPPDWAGFKPEDEGVS